MLNGCIYRTEHDVCKKYTTDKATSFCIGRNCLDRKPSNSDRIRAMTDEELAYFIASDYYVPHCPVDGECLDDHDGCDGCWLVWLQAESGEA